MGTKRLTESQKIVREKIFWLLFKELCEQSKYMDLDKATREISKLSASALEAADKIARENY